MNAFSAIPPVGRVAIFVDGENVGASCASSLDSIAHGYGRVDTRRVYGDAGRLEAWSSIFGYRAMDAGTGKNATDLLLCVDAMELAADRQYETVIIASGDRDFVHLVQRLRDRGVVVIGTGPPGASMGLRAVCNAFRFLERPTQVVASHCPMPKDSTGNSSPAHEDPILRKALSVVADLCGPSGASITAIGQRMRASHDITRKHLNAASWHAYFSNHDLSFDVDPRGPNARVRLRKRL